MVEEYHNAVSSVTYWIAAYITISFASAIAFAWLQTIWSRVPGIF